VRVHFCATCDGPFYRGAKDLTSSGGGNSGLKRDCSHAVRRPRHRRAGLSKLTANKLSRQGREPREMSVLLDTSVTSFNANESGKLESITVSCDGTESIHVTRRDKLRRRSVRNLCRYDKSTRRQPSSEFSQENSSETDEDEAPAVSCIDSFRHRTR